MKTRTIKASHLWPGMILTIHPNDRIYDVEIGGEDIDGTPVLQILLEGYQPSLLTRADTDVDILVEVEQ